MTQPVFETTAAALREKSKLRRHFRRFDMFFYLICTVVTIDTIGIQPTADEVRSFLADKDPAKRDKLVDRLVDSSDYADYFANKWSAVLRNRRKQPTYMRGTYGFTRRALSVWPRNTSPAAARLSAPLNRISRFMIHANE